MNWPFIATKRQAGNISMWGCLCEARRQNSNGAFIGQQIVLSPLPLSAMSKGSDFQNKGAAAFVSNAQAGKLAKTEPFQSRLADV
jgi:hypothetical protein